MPANERNPRIIELIRDLDELKAQWFRLGAPIYHHLRPGLDDSGIARLEEQLGLSLPAERRGLWQWHDGADLGWRAIGPGGMEFLPTAHVVEAFRLNRQTHRQSAPDFLDAYWHATWIPFMNQGPQRLYIDTARRVASGASPVREVTWEWDNYDADLTPSLQDLIRQRTWLLSQDFYSWDANAGIWTCRFEDIPIPVRRWA
jgi:hypothetical protein